jgi:hypothetical protein
MNFKKFLCLLFAFAMALSLCACGGGNDDPTDPSKPSTPTDPTNPTDPTDDGLTEYVITVVDASGNPIAGAFVQICTDHGCIPFDDFTGADGKVSKRVAQDNYKAMISVMPAGYTNGDAADADGYYHFESGATEITIVLKVAA